MIHRGTNSTYRAIYIRQANKEPNNIINKNTYPLRSLHLLLHRQKHWLVWAHSLTAPLASNCHTHPGSQEASIYILAKWVTERSRCFMKHWNSRTLLRNTLPLPLAGPSITEPRYAIPKALIRSRPKVQNPIMLFPWHFYP